MKNINLPIGTVQTDLYSWYFQRKELHNSFHLPNFIITKIKQAITWFCGICLINLNDDICIPLQYLVPYLMHC